MGSGGITSIYGIRHDGMGGRLAAMLNGVRLAELYGTSYTFAWVQNLQAANIKSPSLFFDIAKMASAKAHFCEPNDIFTTDAGGELLYSDNFAPRLKKSLVSSATKLVISCSHLSRFEHESEADVRAAMAGAFARRIHFTQAIEDKVAAIAACGALKTAIGVHVRRGDLLTSRIQANRERAISLERYFEVLELLSKEAPMFLCTEDAEVQAEMVRRYGDRIILPTTRSWDRKSADAAVEAVVEILALSRCQMIVGGISAFNRVGAFIGNRPLITLGNSQNERNFVVAGNTLLQSGLPMMAEPFLRAVTERAPESPYLYAMKIELERLTLS